MLRLAERQLRLLEDGAGVRHRLVEHQREQLVAEVVVVRNVAPRANEPVAPVQARPQPENTADAGVARADPLGVPQEQFEECDEVVGVPLPGGVRLAEAELAARRQPPEERGVVDREAHRRAGAEATRAATGKLDLERAAFEAVERPFEHGGRRALERAATKRRRFGADAHVRTLPSPGTNGGLW